MLFRSAKGPNAGGKGRLNLQSRSQAARGRRARPAAGVGARRQGSARGLEAFAERSVQSRAAAGLGHCESDWPCAILCSCQDVSPGEAAAEPVGEFPHPQKRERTAHVPGRNTSWLAQGPGSRVGRTRRCCHRHCVCHHHHRKILHRDRRQHGEKLSRAGRQGPDNHTQHWPSGLSASWEAEEGGAGLGGLHRHHNVSAAHVGSCGHRW